MRKCLVLGILLFFVQGVKAQECVQELSFPFTASDNELRWDQFPEFSLPFSIVYAGTPRIFYPDPFFSRGFSHAAHPNGIHALPSTRKAYIYYGVASSGQPWGTHKSPFGNDLNEYKKKWDSEIDYFASLNDGSVEVDVFCLDIEMHHKSRDSIVALKQMAFVPQEFRNLSDDAFVQQYQKSMRDLYAEAAKYIKSKIKARIFTAYGDVPIFNTFTNLTGPTWERWQTDPELLNFLCRDGNKAGGAFYDQMDILSPNAYFYYDYPHLFAGDYLAYLMFQIEANAAWSTKDQWVFLWNKYSYTPRYVGQNIKPWMSEAMAIFPFFSGAKGLWIWDQEPSLPSYAPYNYFMKGLYRLAQYKHFFEGEYQLVKPMSAREHLDTQEPIWRGVIKDGKILVVAHQPWASSAEQENALVVRYGNWSTAIKLKGYEVFMCEFPLDVVSGNEPETMQVTVYPNPGKEKVHFTIQSSIDEERTLELRDELGRQWLTKNISYQKSGELELPKNAPSLLFLSVKGKKTYYTQKIIHE